MIATPIAGIGPRACASRSVRSGRKRTQARRFVGPAIGVTCSLILLTLACKRGPAPSASSPADAASDAASDAVSDAFAQSPTDAAVARCGPSLGPALTEGRVANAAIMLQDGLILVAGGSAQGGWSAILEPSTGAMVDTAAPGTTALRLVRVDAGVLMFGEFHGVGPPTEVVRFDPDSRQWTRLPPMPPCTVAGDPAELSVTMEPIALADGRLLVVGSQCAATLEASGTWRETAPLLRHRRGFTLTRLRSGDVLRVGGLAETAEGYLEASTLVDRFDVKRRRWVASAPATYMRYDHGATRLPDGRVLVVGGCEDSGSICETSNSPTPPAEIYDPARDRWTVLGAAAITDRHGATLTALPDGRVVVLGGTVTDIGGPIPPTGLFDQGSWFELPGLTADRTTWFAVIAGDHLLLSDWVPDGGPSALEWYGVAADCPMTPVRLGPVAPPVGGSFP